MKKRLFSRLLKTTVVCILVCMLIVSAMPVAFAASGDIVAIEVEDIEMTQYTNGDVESEDSQLYYCYDCYPDSFTAIYSDGSREVIDDVYEYLYIDSDQSYDNQWGVGTHVAVANLEWYYTSGYSDGISCEFNVTITESPIDRIEVEDIEITAFTNGYFSESYIWNEELEDYEEVSYFKYYVDTYATLYTKDGDSYEISNYEDIYIDGEEYYAYFSSNQSSENQWVEGNTYEAYCVVGGLVQTFNITITDNIISDVEFYDIEIPEFTGGEFVSEEYWDDDIEDYVEYTYYEYSFRPHGVVQTIDGTTEEFNSKWINLYEDWENDIDGLEYEVELSYDQSYENQWTAGNTYEVTANVAGHIKTFNVTITESPIERIEVSDVELIVNTNGRFTYDWVWDENIEDDVKKDYFKYSPEPEITVYTTDGKEYTADDDHIYIGDIYYKIECSDTQSYENRWLPGQTYTASVNVGGVSADFNVTIVESPIVSAHFTVSDQIFEYNGDWDDDYDYEEDEYVEWFNYSDYKYDITGTLTLEDGSVIEIDYYDDLEYNGKYYDLIVKDDQSMDNVWGIGAHQATVHVLGYEAPLTVNVVEKPIKSIKVSDITLKCEIDGYYTEDWDDNEFFYYEINPKVTVELINGEKITTTDEYINIDGRLYSINMYHNQYSNPWGIGKHTVEASVMGVSTEFTVNIAESPVSSIEIVNVKPIVDFDTANSYYSDSAYYYSEKLEFSYKINYKDGSSDTRALLKNEYGNDYIIKSSNVALIDLSEVENWHLGKGNKFTVRYGGATAEGYVEIIDNSDFKYIEQNGELVITEYLGEGSYCEIPETIKSKPVVGVSATAFPDYVTEIDLPDSVKYITGTMSLPVLFSIHFGSGFEEITNDMFKHLPSLVHISISDDNPAYTVFGGAIYNKAIDTLVAVPLGSTGPIYIPCTVKNFDVILSEDYKDLEYFIDEDSKYYKVIDGVTYTSDMKAVVDCDDEKTGDYVMPDSVEKIASAAFANSSLSTVKVSKNVTTIAYQSFMNSSALKKVELPESVTKISKYAFTDCSQLSDVNFPSKLETIASEAFSYCGFESLVIPDSVKTIGSEAFAYQDNLKEAVIGNGVNYLENSTFAACEQLEIVTLGGNVKRLGKSCFSSCISLDNIIIKGDAVAVADSTFYNCPLTNFTDINKITGDIPSWTFRCIGSESVTLSNTVTSIAYNSFGGSSKLKDIEIPKTVLKVDSTAFDGSAWFNGEEKGFVYLDHILYTYKGDMPENTPLVTKEGTLSIADNALLNQINLTSAELNDGIKRIGDRAFYGTSIKEITIPASVEEIGEMAFVACRLLESINVDEANKHFKSVDGVLYNKDMTELIYCPKRPSGEFEVPVSVTTIAPFAFCHAELNTLTISRSDVELGMLFAGFDSETTGKSMHMPNAKYYANYDHLLIRCPQDSTAQEYAREFLLDVEIIDEAPVLELGDVNGDGEISVLDATNIQREVARIGAFTDDQILAADTDKDGRVSVLDATKVQRFVAKIIDEL